MAKFEIEMELTGFKLKVKGEREDIRVIRESLQEQVTGLIAPAANIVRGNLSELPLEPIKPEVISKPKRAARTRRAGAGNGEVASPALDWSHDPGKWGTPRQAWKAWQKILWLLLVAAEERGVREMSASCIVDTFNKHFRQAGLLHKSSMTRDMASLKQRLPALVGDHADKSPITWFPTEEGIKEGQRLVAEAKGVTTQES
jgi:hypothetical protein